METGNNRNRVCEETVRDGNRDHRKQEVIGTGSKGKKVSVETGRDWSKENTEQEVKEMESGKQEMMVTRRARKQKVKGAVSEEKLW